MNPMIALPITVVGPVAMKPRRSMIAAISSERRLGSLGFRQAPGAPRHLPPGAPSTSTTAPSRSSE
jgi:hypothetical protein